MLDSTTPDLPETPTAQATQVTQPVQNGTVAPVSPEVPQPKRHKRLIITIILIIVSPIVLVLLLTAYSFISGDPFFNKSNSYVVCNSIDDELKQTVQSLMVNKHLDGKYYQCGKINADIRAVTSIKYTFRGEYDKARTADQLNTEIRQSLLANGWKAKHTGTNNPYSYVLAKNELIAADYKVLSPKYGLYNLEIGLLDGYKAPDNYHNRTEPKNITLPDDELSKYRSFTLLKPTYVPSGYQSWQQEKDRERDDQSGTHLSFSLTGSANTGRTTLSESMYEAGLDDPVTCGTSCRVIAIAPKGNKIYAYQQDKYNPDQYGKFTTVIDDTLVSFDWPLGRSARDPSNDDAIKVLSSLQ